MTFRIRVYGALVCAAAATVGLAGCAALAGLDSPPFLDTTDAGPVGPVDGSLPADASPDDARDASARDADAGTLVAFTGCAMGRQLGAASQYFCQDFETATTPAEGFDQTSGNAGNLALDTAMGKSGTRSLAVTIPVTTAGNTAQSEVDKEFTLAPSETRVHFAMNMSARPASNVYVFSLGFGNTEPRRYVNALLRPTGELDFTLFVGSAQQSLKVPSLAPATWHEVDVRLVGSSASIWVNTVARGTLTVAGSPVLEEASLRVGNVTAFGPIAAPLTLRFDDVLLEAR